MDQELNQPEYQATTRASSAESHSSVIAVRDLGKRFLLQKPATFQQAILGLARGMRGSPFWALQGISFDVSAGESVGVVGTNGAGKSTLLRLLCGLGRPTRGTVSVKGPVSALLGLGAEFHPDLTGRENLFVSAIVAGGLRKREVRLLFDQIVDFAELRDFIDQPLRTYSLGMRMRLAFAIAIHLDPTVIFIDEALSVGDQHFQQKCYERISRWSADGRTLVLVSHDVGAIREFCSRALWLRRGRLVSDGPVDQVLMQYHEAAQDSLHIGDAALHP